MTHNHSNKLHVITKDAPLVLRVTNHGKEQEWQVYVTVDENGEPRSRISWTGTVLNEAADG